MLEVKIAREVRDSIKKYADKNNMWLHVTLNDVCRMQIVPASASGEKEHSTVLSLQKEEKTILARVTFGGEADVVVRDIDIKDWN